MWDVNAEAKAWNAFKEAFHNYTKNYGDIKLTDKGGFEISISAGAWLEQIGIIDNNADW